MTPLYTAASMWSSLRTVVVLSTVLIARLVSSRPLLFLFFAGPSVTVRENPTFSSVRDQLSNPSYEKSHSQAFGWSAGTPLLLPSCREMLPLVPFVHEESHLGPSFSPNPDSPALLTSMSTCTLSRVNTPHWVWGKLTAWCECVLHPVMEC